MPENIDYKIERAACADGEAVLALYRSLIGTAGCTWNELYPSMEEISEDIARERLYIIRDGEKIVAAAAYGCEPEHEQIGVWSAELKAPAGLFRVGADTRYQRRGLATLLVKHLIKASAAAGYDGMILLVAKCNPAAFALYRSLGFEKCGECVMYDTEWNCCQLLYGVNTENDHGD